MIIHIVGTGTIGEPIIGLLCDTRRKLGIDEITFYKHSPTLTDRPMICDLIHRGAKLCVDEERMKDFQQLSLEPIYEAEEAIARANVVIDCTPKGIGLHNKERYYRRYEERAYGFLAQGSEFGFGKMYAVGINDEAILPEDQYIHIVSCNTHNIAIIIKTLGPDHLEEGRFVCIRRANDISQNRDFIAAPEVGEHNGEMGTHQAVDVYHLYKTLGIELNVFSSALKVNTQYMHCIWFDVKLDKKVTLDEVVERFTANPRVALTNKTSSGLVFSFGRDHGHYGRLLNQTIVVLPTLHVVNGNEVVGFCFTPQDGNSLLSSITAAERFLYPDSYEEKLKCLEPFLFQEV